MIRALVKYKTLKITSIMILRFFSFLLIVLLLISCGGSKSSRNKTQKTVSSVTAKKKKNSKKPIADGEKLKYSSKSERKKIQSIIKYAKSFDGTRYKYGGTTKKGMDCSGLVYTSFKKEDIILPRTSRAMSTQGKKIKLNKLQHGDLLFFKTSKKNVINHVGIVVQTKGEIKFIHASVSKGVTISSLNERYWKNCFTSIRRIQ